MGLMIQAKRPTVQLSSALNQCWRLYPILCSKSRVAPLKKLSIPRIELMSARLLSTVMTISVSAAPFPDFQVSEAPPFSHAGVDFAGPLFLLRGKLYEDMLYHCIFLLCDKGFAPWIS